MPSTALTSLEGAVHEVSELLAAATLTTGTLRQRAARTRVVGRASVVLLSSHFERYFYRVNEEAAGCVNTARVPGDKLPLRLRLEHSRVAYDRLGAAAWDNRANGLADFMQSEGWLWTGSTPGTLKHGPLLAWMKSPMPDNLIRYYKHWGIGNIFDAIARKPHTRTRFRLGVRELVEKRNNIAHGEFAEQVTKTDVIRYQSTILGFSQRADRALSRSVGRLTGSLYAW